MSKIGNNFKLRQHQEALAKRARGRTTVGYRSGLMTVAAATALGPWLHLGDGDYDCRYLGTEYSRQDRISEISGA